MAYSTLHFAPSARGVGDGSTHDNAAALFTAGNLSSLLTGHDFSASGIVALVQNTGTYTQSQALTAGVFTVAAPTSTNNQLRMYAADVSGVPIEPANYDWKCVQGNLDTTGFAHINYTLTTGNMIASNAIHLNGFRITATAGSTTPVISNPFGMFTWCDFTIASTINTSVPITFTTATGGMVNCQVTITGSTGWARIITASTAGLLANLRIVGSATGAGGTMYGIAYSNTVASALSNGPIFIADCPGTAYINYNTATGATIQGSGLTIVDCGIGVACMSTVAGGASRIVLTNSSITGCTTGLTHPYGKYSLNNVVLRNTTNYGVASIGYVGEPAAYITTETDAELYVDSTAGDYRIIATSENWGKNRGVDQPDTVTVTEIPPIASASPTVERSPADTKAITFRFPVSGATITGQVSKDNAAYGAVTGAISFLRTENNKHYYTLAYNAADRPVSEGTARYAFTDGTYTVYATLRISVTGGGGGGGSGDATLANQELILSSLQSQLGNVVASIFERGVDGFPKTLRKKDAATVANGAAIKVRIYDVDDTEYTTPLLGTGTLLFVNATSIRFGLTLINEDVPEVEFAATWVESGGDGYFLIVYNETALDNATSFIVGNNTFHQWGIKVQWPTTTQALTVADGYVKVLDKIVAGA